MSCYYTQSIETEMKDVCCLEYAANRLGYDMYCRDNVAHIDNNRLQIDLATGIATFSSSWSTKQLIELQAWYNAEIAKVQAVMTGASWEESYNKETGEITLLVTEW